MTRALFLMIAMAVCTSHLAAQSTGVSLPQKTTLSAMEVQRLLQGHCDLVASTAGFPKTLRDAFAKITKEPEFTLANPDEEFQLTDVMSNRKLPMRRMAMAGNCGGNWFVHYESGGIVHSYALVVFRPGSKGEMEFVWGGRGNYKASTCAELRSAITSKKFDSDRQYHW